MKPFLYIFATLLLMLTGCQNEKGTVLGKAPKGEAQTILAVRDGITPPEVMLHGTIVEKCPTAGCWFILKDRTGVMKVDTKVAGFVISKIPLETEVTVSGKLFYEGDVAVLSASGLRY
jgi:uncharacterized protein YdeI (BOF family)